MSWNLEDGSGVRPHCHRKSSLTQFPAFSIILCLKLISCWHFLDLGRLRNPGWCFGTLPLQGRATWGEKFHELTPVPLSTHTLSRKAGHPDWGSGLVFWNWKQSWHSQRPGNWGSSVPTTHATHWWLWWWTKNITAPSPSAAKESIHLPCNKLTEYILCARQPVQHLGAQTKNVGRKNSATNTEERQTKAMGKHNCVVGRVRSSLAFKVQVLLMLAH